MKNPINQCVELYKNRAAWRTFFTEMAEISGLPDGVIFSTDEVFLAGFPVKADKSNLPTHFEIRHEEDPNAWFCWAAAGKITRGAFLDAMPFTLEGLIFARDNVLRYHTLLKFLEKLPA